MLALMLSLCLCARMLFQEAVLGKCTVVCISKDQRNPPPSKDELRSADYIFSCTFDVGKLKISGKFPDQIHGIRGKHFAQVLFSAYGYLR